jgi:hypothetical protein
MTMQQIIEADSFKERLEKRLSYMDKNHVDHANVEAVLTRPEGSNLLKEHYFGHNLITDDGEIYYGIKGAGGSPVANENFLTARLEFRTSSDTPAFNDNYGAVTGLQSTTRHDVDSGWPKCPDTDTDNTGLGNNVISYKFSYTTAEGNVTGIVGGVVYDKTVTSPGAGTKLLSHFTITSFDKTSSDTLKFFVNHAVGVLGS